MRTRPIEYFHYFIPVSHLFKIQLLSNTPLQVEISFMKIKSHTSKNTPVEHMQTFYTDFEKMRGEKYDGMIITGAPVEQLDFEAVCWRADAQDQFPW